MRSRHLAWLGALCLALALPSVAAAQAWHQPAGHPWSCRFRPAAPPTSRAGSPGNELAKRVNQQVVIDNRGGAGGLVGAEYVAHAAPDGYTLLLGTISSHSIVPHMYSKMPYDPIGDFTPIAQWGAIPSVLVVNPQLPIHSVKELAAYAAAHPDKLNYGSSGGGHHGASRRRLVRHAHRHAGRARALSRRRSGDHRSAARRRRLHVLPVHHHGAAYRRGQTARARGHERGAAAGAARPADHGGGRRRGLRGHGVAGVLRPGAAAPEIVAKVNAIAQEIMASPAVRESLGAQGIEPVTGSPEACWRSTRPSSPAGPRWCRSRAPR